jgi:peptidoglycan/LPS O-acetylase OafA/YrhL
MSNWLATKIMVFGGFISYSLYMTHLVWFGLWRAGMNAIGIDGGALYALAVVILLGMSFVIAYVMWRFIEEPARVKMRNWIGVRPTPTEEAGEAIVESTDPKTAKPIDVPDRE